ncbi:MAG TPA: MFS transporter [Gemmatimonadales bacterium]|nr:MFS transporter [Gemmatimonadales bacterium]
MTYVNPDSASPPPRLPATVKGLSLVSLFNDFASEMVYPLLPAFVTSLGGGAAILGALDGASDLTSAALKWISGRWSDLPGWRKPLVLIGYGTALLIRPFIALAGSAMQVVGFRVIDRVGKGLRTPARDAMIADSTPAPLMGRAFGFHRGADHFGAVLGSVAAWFLLRRGVAVRDVIAWTWLPGLVVMLILLWVLRRATPVRPLPSVPSATRDATGHVFWGPVVMLSALTLFRVPEALLLLRLQGLGVAVATIPLVWAGLHVVRSAAAYPGGWLSDRIGTRGTVAAGGLVFAAVSYLMGGTPGQVGGVATFLALGLASGLLEPAERSLVAQLAPVRTGRGFGAYHALTGLAALPAGLAFGWVYQDAGAGTALRASAVLMALTALAWLVLRSPGRTPPPPRRTR